MDSRNVQRNNTRGLDEVGVEEQKVFRFKVLLPNGTTVGVTFRDPKMVYPVTEFVYNVKAEYMRVSQATGSSPKPRKAVKWSSENIYLVDALDRKIQSKICFTDFKPNKCHIIRLHDGSGAMVDTFENMWDLTPATEILSELPEDYAFETALADLIDNSLQAVWSNDVNERKLISVELDRDRILIFDTGPGMDDSDEYSLVNWGKMGASRHRPSKIQGIGGKPPYLVPFFGMFGYGGPMASMHLARHASVSSKRKGSKKVYTLHLEREALLRNSGSEHTWKTDGGIMVPLKDDLDKSPHGSYTKVEISGMKMKLMEVSLLQCKLKDIYFPYIQYDEGSSTGRTITPIEFQVNGIDLAEVEGGEVATTNLHSCNGPEFVLQLHFYSVDSNSSQSPGSSASKEANACLKCVYFPIVEGKENIERILEKLKCDGFEITESYETFGRVSIRRLGRLLPDARWAQLPFMDCKHKKGDKARTLQRCFSRVKCFIDTDAGFHPTHSKTDLASHHPFTTTLKNFGNKPSEKEREINVDIRKDGKKLTLMQLEKEYQEWVVEMHDRYDEEIACGTDQPAIVVSPNKKMLSVSSDVVRVHQAINRKERSWKHGQKIKILKGACDGFHKRNIYATVEYFLFEGFQGDPGGAARFICRPLDVQDENGCVLQENNGDLSLDIRSSISLPIGVIDSGKCLPVESAEWRDQIEKQRQKLPSSVDILSSYCCQELQIDGGFPVDTTLYVGHAPPSEIVAVIRPASFISSCAPKNLDQKYIITGSFDMNMDVNFSAENEDRQRSQNLLSEKVTSSLHKGFHGLYRFPLGSKLPDLFKKAGCYTFSFSLRDSSIKTFKKKIMVKLNASSEVRSWGLLGDDHLQSAEYKVRVGECFPPVSIACYDSYGNRIPFPCTPIIVAKLTKKDQKLTRLQKAKVDLSPCKLTMEIKDILIESKELDMLRPTYEATLVISSPEESLSVSVPCHVTPGPIQHVKSQPPNFEDFLKPGSMIKKLVLQVFDAYNNHICEGCEVLVDVEGLSYQDHVGPERKVNDQGRIELDGALKVTAGYGEKVSLSVLFENSIVFKKEITIEVRELKLLSQLPEFPAVGSHLEDIIFEIVDSKGDIDESFHDEPKSGDVHTLTIKIVPMDSEDSVRYAFKHGRCSLPSIPLPQEEGMFCFVASHSCYPEISLSVKVQVVKPLQLEQNYDVSRCSEGMISLLPEDFVFKYSEGLVESIIDEEKKLQDDCRQAGEQIGTCEKTLAVLDEEEAQFRQSIVEMQDSLGIESSQCLYNSCEKEVIMDLIARKECSAPSLFCNMTLDSLSKEPNLSFTSGIVGLVALLGTVSTVQISRILADYLGEDLMLAIVCKSRESANALEKFEENGSSGNSLHALATSYGISIKGRFVIICLEDISPFLGGLTESNGKSVLNLPSPCFGEPPLGFLGYAVNLIDIESGQNSVFTESGFDLRETLFYRLFGTLKVYDTLEHLKQASSLNRDVAVSLDGGIARGDGLISLGYREPEIIFPVVPLQSLTRSQQDMSTLKLIEEMKKGLEEKSANKCMVLTVYEKSKKKFKKASSRYAKFLDEKGQFLRGYYLEYNSDKTDEKVL